MIVRNEACNLPDCLESVRGIFDSIIIVDTGSTDGTQRIARDSGARVVPFAWCDDFSAARNHGLDRVRADYVFRMDADDRLAPGHQKRLRRLLDSLDPARPAAWFCRVLSRECNGSATTIDEHRLWPHRDAIRFRGRIHERIRLELDAPELETRVSDVRIEHAGYSDPATVAAKLRRNLRLLELELAAGPVTDPLTLFDIGRTFAGVERYDEAADALKAFLKTRHPSHELASRIACRRLVEIRRAQHDYLSAIREAQEGLRLHPDDALLAAWVGDLCAFLELSELAREAYGHALRLYRPDLPDAGMPTGFDRLVREAIGRLPQTASVA
jgi:glycosyltransferase involved in cell wall biosynthesis